MKKIVLLSVMVLSLLIGLLFAFGAVDVYYIQTIFKARENAKREVFEQSQSYVEGKRQAALKYYKEYEKSTDNEKESLKYIISQEFANFDEDKYLTGKTRNFIHNCKYE